MADEVENSGSVDGALDDRLARLGKAPVDTSSVERRLDAIIPCVVSAPQHKRRMGHVFYAFAAFLLLAASVLFVIVLMRPSGPRMITSEELVAIHKHYHHHGQSVMAVASVADANALLAREWDHAPQLPQIQGGTITECCLYHLPDCRVACLHLKTSKGSNVTVVVGHASDLRRPDGDMFESGGRIYSINQVGAYHVVATEAANRLVALVADVSRSDLKELIDGLNL